MEKKLRIGLILGMHPFDEISFKKMFDEMEGIEVVPMLLNNYQFDYAGNNDQYDGFVFYNMSLETPNPEETFAGGHKKVGETLFKIGESGQGIVVLHHAILSHPEWEGWNDLLSIPDRHFDYFGGVNVDIHVADTNHPIAEGLKDWNMIDETFLLQDAGEDCDVILTTTCEKSIKTLAWAKNYKQSRVFAMSLGHDGIAFGNESFRKVLENAIEWTCNKR